MMDILKDFCQHSSDNIKREIKNQPTIQLHRKKKKAQTQNQKTGKPEKLLTGKGQ